MSSAPRAFVIGHPISHSRSPLIHGYWLRQLGIEGSYDKIDVPPEALSNFLRSLRAERFMGGNVTVPHKTAVLSLVDEVDEAATAIGAANTLWFADDRLMAGNTDALGFVSSLDASAPGWDTRPRQAVVLGAGGAARAVVYALIGRGFEVCIVNRTLANAVELAGTFDADAWAYSWIELPDLLKTAALLVNTTCLGMAGQPSLEIDLGKLDSDALVCDIVYVPLETDLLRQARKRGHRTVDGLGMLLHQAAPGFRRWFGVGPRVTPALRAVIEADIRGPR